MKKKKTIKINFKYFWEGFNPEDNLFTNLLKKRYNVVISDNPDYMFYSICSEKKDLKNLSKKGELIKKISPRLYLFFRKLYAQLTSRKSKFSPPQGDFVKIFYTGENVKPDMDECDWAFSFYYDEEFKHPRHMRLTNYKIMELNKSLIKKKIDMGKIKKEKTKFCNFLYSQEVPYRNRFFKKLSRYKRIDSPGKSMNNMPSLGKGALMKFSRLPKNWIEEKLDFLKKYKFTIAFENSSAPGYTTEKIYHAMLVNSIPIYFGNPLIYRDFNTKSFVNCHEFKNFDEVVKKVIEIDNDDALYEKYLKEPWFHNNKLSKYMDDKKIEKRLKEIFG